MTNVLSEVKICPHTGKKVRVNILWKEKCDVDYNKKEHIANIEIEELELAEVKE